MQLFIAELVVVPIYQLIPFLNQDQFLVLYLVHGMVYWKLLLQVQMVTKI